jgi:hypothetical protein
LTNVSQLWHACHNVTHWLSIEILPFCHFWQWHVTKSKKQNRTVTKNFATKINFWHVISQNRNMRTQTVDNQAFMFLKVVTNCDIVCQWWNVHILTVLFARSYLI